MYVVCRVHGHIAQSVECLTQKPEVTDSYPVRPHTFVSPSANSRRAIVNTSESMWVVVVVVLLFYVHGKHLRSCRDGQLT